MEQEQYNFSSPCKPVWKNNEQNNYINQFLTPNIKQKTGSPAELSTLHSQTEIQKQKMTFNVTSFNSPNSQKDIYSDRFIPCRPTQVIKNLFGMDLKSTPGLQITQFDDKFQNYNNMLKKELFQERYVDQTTPQKNQNNLLKYRSQNIVNNQILQESPFASKQTQVPQQQRYVSKTAYKILDAPGLEDDYYMDILDWSYNNQIGVSLSNKVYLWEADSGNVVKFAENPKDFYSSLRFNPNGAQLLLGQDSGTLELWDITKQTIVKKYINHKSRIGTLSWNNDSLFASGSKDKSVIVQDIRLKNYSFNFQQHTQEVCGLSFSQNEQNLASGGNDNKLILWSLIKGDMEIKFKEHKAAVRAVEFSRHQNNILISGGGTKDQKICIWNILSHQLINKIEVESQVCKILYSKNSNEFITTHGYENNEIILWKYPKIQKLATLEGHDKRVLYLAQSPDGKTVVTGAGDETLRFWKIFPEKKKEEFSSLQLNNQDIR